MLPDQFILIGDRNTLDFQLVNRDHIIKISLDDGVALHLSGNMTLRIQGQGNEELLLYLMRHSVLGNGDSAESLVHTLAKKLGSAKSVG